MKSIHRAVLWFINLLQLFHPIHKYRIVENKIREKMCESYLCFVRNTNLFTLLFFVLPLNAISYKVPRDKIAVSHCIVPGSGTIHCSECVKVSGRSQLRETCKILIRAIELFSVANFSPSLFSRVQIFPPFKGFTAL